MYLGAATAILFALLGWRFQYDGNQPAFPSLLDATLDDITKGLEAGLFTSVDLTSAYLARIGEVNGALNAVTEVNPDALAIARQLDQDRQSGNVKGLLHGVPILVKNNINTDDKMNNTAGSVILLGTKGPRAATVITKLRESGAIILGKTNQGEWSEGRSLNAPSGWSSHGGQTYGSYHASFGPGGSSSGSAVSVDVGLSAASLATETSGSIIVPAHRNGVVGIKPTVGLTSRYMVVPVNTHQDTVGPLARTVKDAAMLLQVIAGQDERDNYTSAAPSTVHDYVAACETGALKGARIGVPWNIMIDNHAAIDEEVVMFRKALEAMEAAGAVIVEANYTAGLDIYESPALPIAMLADIKTSIETYLADLTLNPRNLQTLEDIRDAILDSPDSEPDKYGTIVFDHAVKDGLNTADVKYWEARQEILRLCGEEGLLGALKEYNLDALVMPSAVSAAFPAYIGSPIVNVPMGHHGPETPVFWDYTGKLVTYAPYAPVGLSFLGKHWDDAKLIGLAYAYEQITKVRDASVQRATLPTTELGIK